VGVRMFCFLVPCDKEIHTVMHKLILLIAIALLGYTTSMAQAPKATIDFEETSYDFGDITQGDRVTHVFKFKNTGKAPLIISDVQVTCGCTVPTKPKEPIMPGKMGEISVSFDSGGKMGKQNKTITVMSNASNAEERVTITSNVKEPKN
jgi:Protein of unknown function (DUF1573)